MSVLWQDQCFRIEEEGGHLWVTELLHDAVRGNVAKRWRIRFSTPGNARRFIATKLRDSHDDMYHFHAALEARAVGQ